MNLDKYEREYILTVIEQILMEEEYKKNENKES